MSQDVYKANSSTNYFKKSPNFWVFSENFYHLKSRPIIRLHLALSAKEVVPREQSSTLIYDFLEKSKNARILFDHNFFALVPELLLLPKNFMHSKIFSVWRFFFRILHCIEDWQLRQKYM